MRILLASPNTSTKPVTSFSLNDSKFEIYFFEELKRDTELSRALIGSILDVGTVRLISARDLNAKYAAFG